MPKKISIILVLIASICIPSKVNSQINSADQLHGTKWCTFDKNNSIARMTYRGDYSYFSSGNTCLSLNKVGKLGAWKLAFEWWSQESKIRVREYALGSWITPKALAYQEAKSARDRRSPYASTTPGTRGGGFINLIDRKTLKMSQLGRGANGDVTLLVYYLEKVDAFPEIEIPLTYPLSMEKWTNFERLSSSRLLLLKCLNPLKKAQGKIKRNEINHRDEWRYRVMDINQTGSASKVTSWLKKTYGNGRINRNS